MYPYFAELGDICPRHTYENHDGHFCELQVAIHAKEAKLLLCLLLRQNISVNCNFVAVNKMHLQLL